MSTYPSKRNFGDRSNSDLETSGLFNVNEGETRQKSAWFYIAGIGGSCFCFCLLFFIVFSLFLLLGVIFISTGVLPWSTNVHFLTLIPYSFVFVNTLSLPAKSSTNSLFMMHF
jgi:hypothetical protein